jgi:hypothetical protein
MMDFGGLAPACGPEVVDDLVERGFHLFGEPVDPDAASGLLRAIRATRSFDERLFLSEAEFDADPQYRGVNPRPGRNLLEAFADRLAFVEAAPHLRAALAGLLGPGYSILDRKVVCGVAEKSIPGWIRRRIAGNPVNNLGGFVRPQYRDVTYFYGIDFHQDLIDYKDRRADFVTLYVYLHAVDRSDAPLFVLDGSHRLGAAVFPHDLTPKGGGRWAYRNGDAGEIEARQVVLTGAAGFAAVWHACTLHGTQPDAADSERISLRYLLARQPGGEAGIDVVNARLSGPLSLAATRVDLRADGAAAMKGNAASQA